VKTKTGKPKRGIFNIDRIGASHIFCIVLFASRWFYGSSSSDSKL